VKETGQFHDPTALTLGKQLLHLGANVEMEKKKICPSSPHPTE